MSNHKMNMKPNYIPNLNMTSSMKGFTNELFKREVFFSKSCHPVAANKGRRLRLNLAHSCL